MTLNEFWALPENERGKAYQNLSSHDRFLVRVSMAPGEIPCQCNSCRHHRGFGKCDAFPAGIPKDILSNRILHNHPVPGDGGIQYTEKQP